MLSFFVLFQCLECHEQFLIEFLFHAVLSQVINGGSPAVLLIGSQWEFIGLFGLFLVLLVEVSVPFGLLVVAILVDFEFVKLMGLIESIIIFAKDVEVGRNGFLLSDLLELYISSYMKYITLSLSNKGVTLSCSL